MEEPEEDGSQEPQELEPAERENIEADLDDLSGMKMVFAGQGVRGVVIACPDCGSNHFYEWDLLRESLEHMLKTGEPRMHEPAFEPREDEYIQWDYGKGYIDALSDTGLQPDRRIEVTACPWCETPVEDHFGFCPRCGRSLAALRLYRELVDRGTDEREVRSMLVRAGFEPF
jgi:RNA polymerase subunit RPABC4/transcription elongation factor Spt4